MPVFSRFNPRGVGRGGVLKQSHPASFAHPWVPLQTTVRTDNQWGGRERVHRVQPHERGTTFARSLAGSWTNNAAFVDTTAPTTGKSNPATPIIPSGPVGGGAGAGMGSGGGGCGGCNGCGMRPPYMTGRGNR
jgi:hypothetical protein